MQTVQRCRKENIPVYFEEEIGNAKGLWRSWSSPWIINCTKFMRKWESVHSWTPKSHLCQCHLLPLLPSLPPLEQTAVVGGRPIFSLPLIDTVHPSETSVRFSVLSKMRARRNSQWCATLWDTAGYSQPDIQSSPGFSIVSFKWVWKKTQNIQSHESSSGDSWRSSWAVIPAGRSKLLCGLSRKARRI